MLCASANRLRPSPPLSAEDTAPLSIQSLTTDRTPKRGAMCHCEGAPAPLSLRGGASPRSNLPLLRQLCLSGLCPSAQGIAAPRRTMRCIAPARFAMTAWGRDVRLYPCSPPLEVHRRLERISTGTVDSLGMRYFTLCPDHPTRKARSDHPGAKG